MNPLEGVRRSQSAPRAPVSFFFLVPGFYHLPLTLDGMKAYSRLSGWVDLKLAKVRISQDCPPNRDRFTPHRRFEIKSFEFLSHKQLF